MNDQTSKAESTRELGLRVIVLSILLTLLLATANAYLALKLGILTSASIPAAIISMGILRFFKNASILENNAVQTAASAGEAVAGGIVYTIPALIVIGYWHGFDYWTNFFIAFSGGVLGVLFSIPLRHILVHEPVLRFPEGQAIAAVLKTSANKNSIADVGWGGLVGAMLELMQSGFKIIADQWSVWFTAKRSFFGFNLGFSATMIGAGYLVGHEMAASIFMGAMISWVFGLPLLSYLMDAGSTALHVPDAVNSLWNNEMRYMGIGAMLFAGAWTFMELVRPLMRSIRQSLRQFNQQRGIAVKKQRVEQDMPMPYILIGIFLMAPLLFLFFQYQFPIDQLGAVGGYAPSIVFVAVLYVLIIGFLFSVITAYFSGMVGVTASPGSSVVIAGMLFAAWLLLQGMTLILPMPFSTEQLQAASAITIMIGSVVTGIAAIANDNTQDLKVGQLVGATPWKQQLMLLLGVLISSLIIPLVMRLLFEAYGIAGIVPHPDMDVSQTLPAPTAAVMAAVTQAVFFHHLPWHMMLIGVLVILVILLLQRIFSVDRWMRISILGVAIGMYLPMTSSFPLFLGGLMSWLVQRSLNAKGALPHQQAKQQRGVLIACGLVAGAAVMDVILAVPFSMMHNADALSLVSPGWHGVSIALAIVSTFGLGIWIYQRSCSTSD